jgi:hypothetical protein
MDVGPSAQLSLQRAVATGPHGPGKQLLIQRGFSQPPFEKAVGSRNRLFKLQLVLPTKDRKCHKNSEKEEWVESRRKRVRWRWCNK